MEKTIILGDEFDGNLKSRLLKKLQELNAIPVSSDWGMAGSQEIESLSVRVRDQIIYIESEKFVGFTISGPQDIVDEISFMLEVQT